MLRSLDGPDGLRPILKDMRRGDAVAVIIDDPRCMTPTEDILRPLLSYLESSSIDSSDVRLVVATTHLTRPTAAQVQQRYGPLIEQGYSISVHDPSDSKNLLYIGDTPSAGTPVDVNGLVLRAQLKVAVSSVRPKCIVGATGGSMSVLPGVVSERTRIRNARLALRGSVMPLSIDNMIVRDMNECAEMVGLSRIVNVVMDAVGHPVSTVVGEHQQAWRSAVETCRHLSQVWVQRRADITVVSAGGHPHDSTLFDAIDALPAAQAVTRRDGVIILVAECIDGPGPDAFVEIISQSRSSSEVRAYLEEQSVECVNKAWLFWQALESNRLVVCSELRARLVTERLHAIAVRDPDEGVMVARGLVGRPAHVALMPEGSATVPILTN